VLGRPLEYPYSDGLAHEICERIAGGESLKEICASNPTYYPPEHVVRHWGIANTGGFFSLYARARIIQADYYADMVLELAGSLDRNSASKREVDVVKVKIDTLKWIVGKLLPRKYLLEEYSSSNRCHQR
jgi:hypothetical protein